MDTLTLDTNIMRDWAWCEERSHECRHGNNMNKKLEIQHQFHTLIQLRDNGECELGVTNIIFADFNKDGEDKLPDYISEMIGPYVEIASPTATIFPWEFPAIFVDPEEIENILKGTFPGSKPEHKKYSNNHNDALQLYAHLVAERDYFLTCDTGILRKTEKLNCDFGIKVLSLNNYLSLKKMGDEIG